MIKTLLFLTALGLVQGAQRSLKEPHPDCPESGAHYLLPHEYDCTKFYYCENGEKFIEPRDCAPGTEFSATLQVCIHPVLADCNLPGHSTEGEPSTTEAIIETTSTTTQDPSTTTAATTTSNTEATTTTTTAAPTTTTTAAPTSTTSAAPTSTTSAAPTSTTSAAPTTTTQTPTTTGNPDSDTTDSCEYLDNGCPVDFDIHLLLPHETSCRKFYYCVFGEKVLSSCARGSVFNPDTQNCDHPGSIDRTCEEEDSSEEEESVEENENEEIELLPNGCPADFDISMYLPNENYCNKYYQCIFGQKVDRYCAPGTHFSFDLQTCDHIANVNCQLPGGDATQVVTDPPVTTTTARPQIDFGENGCPIDGSINWLLPHEDDCNKFYFCVWGGKVESVCPGNLHFNVQTQACDNPATAGCLPCSGGSGCGSCNDESEECTGTPDDNITVPDTSAPSSDTTAAPTVTTAAPTVTTAAPTVTTAAPTVTTAAPTVTTAAPTVTTAAPTVTTAAPTVTTAAPTVTTAAPTVTTAAPTVTTAAPTDTTAAPIVPTTLDDSEEDLPINDDGSGDDCVDVPGQEFEENKKCEEECNVVPWAHEDCDKYWTCEGQKAVLIVCTEGLHFNPSTRTCDFACNAGCVRENVQATAGYDGLKLFLPWNKIDENTKNLLKLVAY